MLGFMNAEAYAATQASGEVTFFSRSRNKLWRKGEQSGHVLRVREIRVDCDVDTLLIRVDALGPGVCHEGYRSCFFRQTFSGRRSQSGRGAHVRSQRRVRKGLRGNERASSGHSQRQPAGRDRCSCLPRRDGAFRSVRAAIFPGVDDPEINCMLVRAQEMARYVETGALDAGITGRDWVLETGADVAEIGELLYSKQSLAPVRWVLAVPEDGPIQSVKDLEGKVIATEVVNLTKTISCAQRRECARGIFLGRDRSEGAAAGRRHRGSDRDRFVACAPTACASSIRFSNRARCSSPITRAAADPWKEEKISNLALLLSGAIAAYTKVGIMLNVRKEQLAAVLGVLPALKNPTVSTLSDPDWIAVNTIIDEDVVRTIIPRLKAAGAQGIVEYPLNKIVL